MSPKQAKCRFCQASIEFFRSPFTGNVRKFDAKPVDGRTHQGPPAFPVEGTRAWKVLDLVEDLRVRRETSEETARGEVYDMPWYMPHDCPASPFKADGTTAVPEQRGPSE